MALGVLLLALVGPVFAVPYQVPDAELLLLDFGPLAGYSTSTTTLDAKADVPGPGVVFLLTLGGPDDGKIGIGDPWPTNAAANFGWDPILHHWTSLADYDTYEMSVTYVIGPPRSTVDVGLILNTGLTGPSGYPSNDVTNNTFWAGPWFTIDLGETQNVVLDFASAEAYGITDNKWPHTGGDQGWPDGGPYAINLRDLNELSNIGMQVADFDGDALGSPIVLLLNGPLPEVIPEPATLVLLGLGALALRRRRR